MRQGLDAMTDETQRICVDCDGEYILTAADQAVF